MKKIFFTLMSLLGSVGAVKWGDGAIFWIGFGILAFASLTLFVILTWGLVKLFQWTKTLALYNILSITTLCILTIKGVIGVNVGLATTIPLAAIFSLILLRLIGTHAQTSVIWGEIFSWLTGYKIKNFIKVENNDGNKLKEVTMVKVDEVVDKKEERDNIIAVLVKLEFKNKDAKEAANYAIQEKPNSTTEEKVKCALNYLHSDKVLETM
jgi:hypothetical protein